MKNQKYVNYGQASAAGETASVMQERYRRRLTSVVTMQREETLHQITSLFNVGVTQHISHHAAQQTLHSILFRRHQPTSVRLLIHCNSYYSYLSHRTSQLDRETLALYRLDRHSRFHLF